MDPKEFGRQLRAARRGRNFVALFAGALVVANTALALNILRETNQVVLVPSRISDGMVARGVIDHRYVEAITLDAVYGMYNVHKDTLEYGRAIIARVSSSSQRADLLEQYDRIAEDITIRKISTVFYPRKLTVVPDGLSVSVAGQLATFLETTRTSIEERTIVVGFEREGASVRVNAISVVADQK